MVREYQQRADVLSAGTSSAATATPRRAAQEHTRFPDRKLRETVYVVLPWAAAIAKHVRQKHAWQHALSLRVSKDYLRQRKNVTLSLDLSRT